MIDRLRLYLVADPDLYPVSFLNNVAAALAGGVTAVQLRAKSLTDREAVAIGRELRGLTARHGAAYLVNDRLDIALATGADGVHLGVSDLDPADARRIAPAGFLIGYSPDAPGDIAGADVADYYGIGPVFGTRSKADAGAALGLETFSARVAASPVPVVGIGGVGASNAGDVLECGAVGVAIISAILGAPDPREAARALREALDRIETTNP